MDLADEANSKEYYWPRAEKKVRVLAVDTESSGNGNGDRILQLGWKGITGEEQSIVIDPGWDRNYRRHPYDLLHPRRGRPRITQEQYDNRVFFEEKAQFIFDLLNGAHVIFHNGCNDKAAIEREYEAYNEKHVDKPIPCPKFFRVSDTHTALKDTQFPLKKGLSKACTALHIPPPVIPHNAGYDAAATFRLMVVIANRSELARDLHFYGIFPKTKTPFSRIGEDWLRSANMEPIATTEEIRKAFEKRFSEDRKRKREEESLDEGQFPMDDELPCLDPAPELDDPESDLESDMSEDESETSTPPHITSVYFESPRVTTLLCVFKGDLSTRCLRVLPGFSVTRSGIENMLFLPYGCVGYSVEKQVGVLLLHSDCIYKSDTASLREYLSCLGLNLIQASDPSMHLRVRVREFDKRCFDWEADQLYCIGSKQNTCVTWKGLDGHAHPRHPWKPRTITNVPPDWREVFALQRDIVEETPPSPEGLELSEDYIDIDV